MINKKEIKINLKKLMYMTNKRLATKILYRYYQGVKLDLDNPKSFNEKLQWMKFNYYNELMVKCTDKYLVREYLEEKGYGHLLNDLYGVYEKAEDIDFDELPDSFVLKANHGCKMNIIVNDKKDLDIEKTRKQLNKWLKENYYWRNLDWVYKDIKPKIIAERNLSDENGEVPNDYKVICFNGEPLHVKVDSDRFGQQVNNLYNLDWSFSEYYPAYSDRTKLVEKPGKLEELLEVSRELSEDFPHARVDLYIVDEKIVFGELTFFHGSGFNKFTPEYDIELGELLKLPELDKGL